ncbi:LysR family transcriptional regulator [Rhizobium laguerreae]|uniref:LysR family transcriptional regulator n=1 Tax=Rhizobium laguerreae TaxID=1076926 RepID=UPI001C912F01|nr:LysR family transcriptional regulator [Rhizobium laguerreae]MBY3346430.1 LysR family transcriptional regulator [Rhizobium laguerreae]MBY3353391.1 LysR family transcriptional regulator [Rhizobium laguerreae]MBY3374437.1 LysR family transcriptional regulator [Rhizobium laguerreae]MBY3429667.1 LysR family transcriptional regulator [Rhizobium laguerreae]MBY3438314.1 LysR family transcriptional regulator [Rhizobium laguerreae]
MSLFRSMQVFVTTVQEGSMSAASGKLGMSPAMVGQHVAALEERLGTRLLNRTTRRQSLTDFGASYVEQCRDILERVALADQDAEALQAEPRGKLKMTAPTTFGAEVLMPRLQRYRELAPDVTLDITLTDRNVDIVDEGFDIAFRIGELPDSRLIARRLAPYRMMICAAPDYLARRGNPEHPRDLANHDAIGFAPAARSPWKLTKGDDRVEVAPQMSITVNSGQAVRMAGRAGLGVIMQPSILLSSDVEAGLLVQLFPDWQLRERPMSLVYHRDRRMTPRLRSLISFAISEFGATSERREDHRS